MRNGFKSLERTLSKFFQKLLTNTARGDTIKEKSRGVMNDLSVEGKTLKNFKAMRKNLLTSTMISDILVKEEDEENRF